MINIKIKKLFRYAIVLSFVFLITCNTSKANIFVADILSGYLPTISVNMAAGAHEKRLILPGNEENTDGLLVLSFEEERDFYGFSILICNQVNANLYEAREKAACFRKEINLKTDILKFKYKGQETYYIFIVNRTRPLSVSRKIKVTPTVLTSLNEKSRKRLKLDIENIGNKLTQFFGMKSINYGVIPCHKNYVPSSPDKNTITICSELIIDNKAVHNSDLLNFAVFYEMIPLFEKIWRVKDVKTLTDRLQFATTFVFIFSDDKKPLEKQISLYEFNDRINTILANYDYLKDKNKDRITFFNELIKISNDPFSSIDYWIEIIYSKMDSKILEKIKTGEFQHYGHLRNNARLVLKRRLELEIEANTIREEPKNIISDFW